MGELPGTGRVGAVPEGRWRELRGGMWPGAAEGHLVVVVGGGVGMQKGAVRES